MFLLHVILVSRMVPSSFRLMFMGTLVLFICTASCVLYSAGSGVKRGHVF